MTSQTPELTGWLLDLYSHPENGIVLWLLGEDGVRHRLRQAFPVTFYAAGANERLRALWRYLQEQSIEVHLYRTQRHDLFTGMTTVLAAQVQQPAAQPGLFRQAARLFPDLNFYDADLRLSLRYAAVTGAFPLAQCKVSVDEDNNILNLVVLDSQWDLDPLQPPLQVMRLEPDVDPFHAEPKQILVHTPKGGTALNLEPNWLFLKSLRYLLKRYDPDLLLTAHGDTWLFPLLLKLSKKENFPLPLNRDLDCEIATKAERVYHAYGQIIYRGPQHRLFGRWHIDIHNAVMYHDYQMEGVWEMARVSCLPVQTAARVSPGTGISSMQIVTALRQEILVPYRKQQAEQPKTAIELLRADMGGLVFQPKIGLHEDVAEVDFISMYPSIMVEFNISPETILPGQVDPKTGLPLTSSEQGLIPKTLEPLVRKRKQLKQQLLTLPKYDCCRPRYKAMSAAQKWLLVTCFGYLGYKNARFGRIEAHEAVTAYGREILLRAKETAEKMDFEVLHLYVDGMWVKKPGFNTVQNYQALLEAILDRTGLDISLDGIYNFVAFLPSRVNPRIPVPNRYFGVFQSGEVKTRGIEIRRHDTPAVVKQMQKDILDIMAGEKNVENIRERLPEIRLLIRKYLSDLRTGRVPMENLLVHHTVSRAPGEFRVVSPAAAALKQLQLAGKSLRPGQHVRFLYTLGKPGARAWDMPTHSDLRTVDVTRYRELLLRAAHTILEPFGMSREEVDQWILENVRAKRMQFNYKVASVPRNVSAQPLKFHS